jgi:formylglycine-generating enzyme required for sulfatase activity
MVTDAAVGVQAGRDREMAIRQVDRFEGRYGSEILDFACHAAFPLTLTTDVGYLLRQEYFPELGWSVAAELLLSNLCEVAGYDLYVIRVAVRAVLLERLVDRFGAGRVDELAGWMARYIQHRLAIEPLGRAKVLGYPSHWTALACLKGDDEVTQAIKAELRKLLKETDDPRERFRLSALIESQGDLLSARGLQPLKLKELSSRLVRGEDWDTEGESSWDRKRIEEWAIAQNIQLVSQVVPIATIRFDDDPNVLREFQFEVVKLFREEIVSRETKTGSYFIEPLGSGVKPLELVAISGGEFMMGSDERDREQPKHKVTLQPFFISRYPITESQWQVVSEYPSINRDINVRPNSSRDGRKNFPIEWISWDEAQEFCNRLSARSGRNYFLPSESQWEYACRAGSTTSYHYSQRPIPHLFNCRSGCVTSDGISCLPLKSTSEVGLFPPNNWGLHDMHGNVWEWCEDDWHKDYEQAPNDGTAWVEEDREDKRVIRGGAWNQEDERCSSSYRAYYSLSDHVLSLTRKADRGPRMETGTVIGFRICCS